MSEELQSDEVVVDNDEYVEVNESEDAEIEADESESSELATDSEPQHEENSDEPKFNQEAVNKVINRKHYEAQEAKREAEELKRQLQQYQQSQQQSAEPEVKDYFDYANDDEYRAAVEKRAQWRYERQMAQQRQYEQMQLQQQEQQAKLAQAANKYMESAKANGISQEEVVSAGQVVESYGLGVDLQMHLLNDPDGALIVKHLAANPTDVINLSQMSPYQAGVYIEQNLRPAAKQLKPKSTNAPKPPKRTDGGSVDPELGRYKHIGGAKFE